MGKKYTVDRYRLGGKRGENSTACRRAMTSGMDVSETQRDKEGERNRETAHRFGNDDVD